MPRTRKIFASHGGELAHKLLGTLEGEHIVEHFVDSYVAEYDRRGLKAHPLRYRELLATLGREAWLAMVAQVNAELPRYLTRRRPSMLRGAELELAEAFRQEILASLGRALRWTPADAEEFRRDLDLYAQLAARTAIVKKHRKPTDPPEGPFVDRCALLLDPSMLDKARRAAGKFLAELERVTEKGLDSIFRPRRRV
jgi:hypothetical protein